MHFLSERCCNKQSLHHAFICRNNTHETVYLDQSSRVQPIPNQTPNSFRKANNYQPASTSWGMELGSSIPTFNSTCRPRTFRPPPLWTQNRLQHNWQKIHRNQKFNLLDILTRLFHKNACRLYLFHEFYLHLDLDSIMFSINIQPVLLSPSSIQLLATPSPTTTTVRTWLSICVK